MFISQRIGLHVLIARLNSAKVANVYLTIKDILVKHFLNLRAAKNVVIADSLNAKIRNVLQNNKTLVNKF